MNIIGILCALPLFSQLDIGINFSFAWLILILYAILYSKGANIYSVLPVVIVLMLLALKFGAAKNIESSARYVLYAGLLISCVNINPSQWAKFFEGFGLGLIINFLFASAQYLGIILQVWDGLLMPKVWNRHLWHANPPGGLFVDLPRVSGLTNEPAYLGIVVLFYAAYRMLVAGQKTLTGWFGVYLGIFIFVFVNSRTAAIGYFLLVVCHFFVRYRTSAGVATYLWLVASFIVIPVTLISSIQKPIDYDSFLLEDISLFARSVPFLWVAERNNLTFMDLLFGVTDYHSYVQGVSMPVTSHHVFGLQGGFRDPKSLGGAYMFDMGIVGVLIFTLGVAFTLRRSKTAIVLFGFYNVIFFNVYAFSWPIFWVGFAVCVSMGHFSKSLSPRAE